MTNINFLEKNLLLASRSVSKWIFHLLNHLRMPDIAGIEKNIAYLPQNTKVKDKGCCVLDVIKPVGEAPFPVVMLIHGGGFIAGDKQQLTRLAAILANRGYLVFNVNYRLSPEVQFPAHLSDCVFALDWVRKNAESYGGDISRVCVGGGSAGGYLSGAVVLASQNKSNIFSIEPIAKENFNLGEHPIKAALLLNGVFDVRSTAESNFPRVGFMLKQFFGDNYSNDGVWERANLIDKITGNFPSTFIGVGTSDSLYKESLALSDQLRGQGVDVVYKEYEGSGHGWFNAFWQENAKKSFNDMVDWLDNTL